MRLRFYDFMTKTMSYSKYNIILQNCLSSEKEYIEHLKEFCAWFKEVRDFNEIGYKLISVLPFICFCFIAEQF